MSDEPIPEHPPTSWANPNRPGDRRCWFGAAKDCPREHRPASITEFYNWRDEEIRRRQQRELTAVKQPLAPPKPAPFSLLEPVSGAPEGLIPLDRDELARRLQAHADLAKEPIGDGPRPPLVDPSSAPAPAFVVTRLGDHGGPKADDPPPSFSERRRRQRAAAAPASNPPPTPTPRPMAAETYESILRAEIESGEVESLRVAIRRNAPDPGDLGELNALDDTDNTASLAALKTYILGEKGWYDGRSSLYVVKLLVDDEEAGSYKIQIAKDPVRQAEAEADREAQIAQVRAQRGLPPLPPRGAPVAPVLGHPAPLATPPGYLSPAEVAEMIERAQTHLIVRLGLVGPQAPAPAAAASQPAPEAGYITKADADAMVRRAVEEAAAKLAPTAPAAPAAPPEAPKTPLDVIREGVRTVTAMNDELDKAKGALGIEDAAPAAEEKPFIDHNGLAIPVKMLKDNPTGAMLAMNLPLVQGVIGGIKDGFKEAIGEVAKVRREEVAILAKENDELQRKIALQRQAQQLSGPSVVDSEGWPDPRGKR